MTRLVRIAERLGPTVGPGWSGACSPDPALDTTALATCCQLCGRPSGARVRVSLSLGVSLGCADQFSLPRMNVVGSAYER